MPLKEIVTNNKKLKNKMVSENIRELIKDNEKSGKEMGAGGKKRPMKQIIAIALSKIKPKK